MGTQAGAVGRKKQIIPEPIKTVCEGTSRGDEIMREGQEQNIWIII